MRNFNLLFQEEQRHFLQGTVMRLSLPPFVSMSTAAVVGAGVAPNWSTALVLALAACYAFFRYRLVKSLRQAVRSDLSRASVRWWRQRLAVHLGLQGLLWAVAAVAIVPHLSLPLTLLFLCVMVTVLGVVCILLPAPVVGLRMMCFCAYAGGIGTAALAADDLQRGLVLCGLLGLCSQEFILERNAKAIRSRLRATSRSERMRQRLLERSEQLARLSHSKSLLLATASHDLRQPVHALALLTERLGRDVDPSAAQERIATVRATSEYLLELLNKLMDYSRVELGRQSVSLADVEVGALVEQAVRAMREIAIKKQLALTLEISGRWQVRTDPALLGRILHNLLDNALKFTVRGGVACRVELVDGQVEISVTDTGPGIPEAVLGESDGPHLRSPEVLGGGLGLGLGVVRGLCKLLDCDFSAQVDPGRGSCIRLRLAAQAEFLAPQTARPDADDPPFRAHTHVLLVEDNPVILKAMTDLLLDLDLQVHAFDSGESAVAGSTGLRVDLVISDLHLGSLPSGLDVIRAVRARPGQGDLPALLLSGDIAFEVPGGIGDAGIGILHKPASPRSVRRAVGRALGCRIDSAATSIG